MNGKGACGLEGSSHGLKADSVNPRSARCSLHLAPGGFRPDVSVGLRPGWLLWHK
jgi:hypothetical protein